MQGQPAPDHASVISMLQQLNAAGVVGEMPYREALDFANVFTHGHGQDLLNDLALRNLIMPVGSGAIRLVRITGAGREALASGNVPVVARIAPTAGRPEEVSGAYSRPVKDAADRLAARMRERAGFIATIAGGVITLAALLESIGVPEAQSATARSNAPLDLWDNAWSVAGIVIGAFGLALLLAAAILYVSRRHEPGKTRRDRKSVV